MGLLYDKDGTLSLQKIGEIDQRFAKLLESNEAISAMQLEAFVKKAHHHFRGQLTRCQALIASLKDLDHSSYGVPTGHDGVNEFLFGVLEEIVSESAIKEEMETNLKARLK